MAGRGRKINQVKNERSHAEWMAGKKLGRKKQQWVWDTGRAPSGNIFEGPGGYWEKV
jgi:hypothetical protein